MRASCGSALAFGWHDAVPPCILVMPSLKVPEFCENNEAPPCCGDDRTDAGDWTSESRVLRSEKHTKRPAGVFDRLG
jgi:hypothetical protein